MTRCEERSRGHRVRTRRAAAVLAAAVLSLTGCSDDPSDGPDTAAPATSSSGVATPAGSAELLAAVTDEVIVPGYREMVDASAALADGVRSACAAGGAAGLGPDALETTRTQYREARAAWRSTLAFRVGPAMKHRLMPAVDFPVEPDKIEELLASEEPITVELVSSQGSDRRGLRAVEAVLFAGDGSTMSTTDPARRCAYAAAAAQLVREAGDRVLAEWSDYRAELVGTPADSLADLVNETIFTLEGVVDGPLAVALGVTAGEPDPAAANVDAADPGPDRRALADAVADLDGVLEVYTALIAPLARLQSADAAERVESDLRSAHGLLVDAPDPLATAAATANDELVAAHAALDAARISLETEIASLLGITLTFSDSDGDS